MLAARLRLIVLSHPQPARGSTLLEVIAAVLDAGAPAIQLRDKTRSAGELLPLARDLRELTRAHDALFFVNDRLDLALAAEADGVHLGPDDLPVEAARRATASHFLIGFSTDDPDQARRAEAEGADYLGCGTVWPTSGKVEAGQAIGVSGLEAVARAVNIPVVGIGGIDVARAQQIMEGSHAAGVAVLGCVLHAPDPGTVTSALLSVVRSGGVR